MIPSALPAPPLALIVKLGGAAITDKSRRDALDRPVLEASARHLAAAYAAGARMVLVHGAGA